MIKQAVQCSEKELWDKFSILTDEMKKFLAKDDIDEFLALNQQRIQIEKMIAAKTEKLYIQSDEGQAFLKQLILLNETIYISIQRWLNATRSRKQVTNSYESLGYKLNGFRVDGKL